MEPDPSLLLQLTTNVMPYGKYKGHLLCDIPMYYLEWLQRTALPPGKTGELLQLLYEIKLNGLEYLLTPLKTPK